MNNKYYITTMYYHERSIVKPTFYKHKKNKPIIKQVILINIRPLKYITLSPLTYIYSFLKLITIFMSI